MIKLTFNTDFKLRKIYILIAIILFSSIDEANAQRRRRRSSSNSSSIKSEIGGNIGISNAQGDFTGKGPGDGIITVNGFSINGTYSAHILPKRRSVSRDIHFMFKANIGYTSASFDNLGVSSGKEALDKPAGSGDYSQTNNNIILGRIKTETSILTAGIQVEYYFKDLVNFLHKNGYSRRRTHRSSSRYRQKSNRGNPYVALGLGINSVKSTPTIDPALKANSVGSNNGLPDNFTVGMIEGINSTVFSGTAAAGYRYKINRNVDFVGEFKFNLYFSDRIDAVNPSSDPTSRIEDVSYDFNSVFSAGIIYHLF